MNLFDLGRISVSQIMRHRRRYYGVILAITLGIGGLQTVIMISRDFKKNVNRDLALIGEVTILKAYFDNQLTYRPMAFQPKTLEALRSLPGVEKVSVVAFHAGKASSTTGSRYNFPVIAMDEAFWQVRSFWARTGRLFGQDAVAGRKRECVLGASLAEKIFGRINIAGLTIEINNEPYLVTGVLGGITDSTLANSAYLPITTVEDRFPGLLLADRVYLRCVTLDDVIPVATSLAEVVRTQQPAEQLCIELLTEGLTRVKRLFWWAEFLVYLTIGATLLLGGLGIWNVMMAAVRSRTREIGLKKAVGADDTDILKQFLAEAMVLSLGASFLGIILGRVLVEGLSLVIDSRPPEYLFLICVGLGLMFGTFLGIVAGLFPSIQASRMEVVDAIRYE